MVHLAISLMALAPILVIGVVACWLMLDRRHVLHLLYGIGVASAAVLAGAISLNVRNTDLVVLQAGLSHLNIGHVFGEGNHFCFTCRGFSEMMSAIGSHRLPIQDTIFANRILSAVNVAGFVAVAMKVTRNWLYSLLCAAAAFFFPVVALGASSNYSSAFLMSLMLVVVLCGAVFAKRAILGNLAAALSVITLGMVTALSYLSRPEMAVPGVVALCVMVGSTALFARRASRVASWIRELWRIKRNPADESRWWSGASGRIALVASLFCAFSALSFAGFLLRRTAFPVWVIDGANPFDVSTWTAVVDLFRMIPVPMAILVLVGLWRITLKPFYYLGLPVSLIFLMKTGASASRDDLHTIFRMFSVLTPLLLLPGLWGVRYLHQRLSGKIGHIWTNISMSLFVAVSVFLVPSYSSDFLMDSSAGDARVQGLERPGSMLNRNPQLEVRFIVAALDSHPDCMFVSRVLDFQDYSSLNSGHHSIDLKDVWFSRSGMSMNRPEVLPECVLFYRSMDCDLFGLKDCEPVLEHATAVSEISFTGRPYGNYLLVDYDDPVTLGLYLPQP